MNAAKICSLIGNILNGFVLSGLAIFTLTAMLSFGENETLFFGLLFLWAIFLNLAGWLAYTKLGRPTENFWRKIMLMTGICSLGNLPAGILLIIASQISKKTSVKFDRDHFAENNSVKFDRTDEDDWSAF